MLEINPRWAKYIIMSSFKIFLFVYEQMLKADEYVFKVFAFDFCTKSL